MLRSQEDDVAPPDNLPVKVEEDAIPPIPLHAVWRILDIALFGTSVLPLRTFLVLHRPMSS